MYGIGNIKIDAYSHEVTIYVGRYQFKTKIKFSYEQQIPLLGRIGFFNAFKEVLFLESEKQIKLSY